MLMLLHALYLSLSSALLHAGLCPGTVVIVHAAMPDSADPTFDEGFGSLLFMLATVGEHSDV